MSQYRMPFGKYKGEPLSDLPDDYLQWVLDNCELREPWRWRIEDEYQSRQFGGGARRERWESWGSQSAPGPAGLPAAMRATACEIVRAGYRAVALRRHPDRGGRHEAMVELNAVRDALLRLFDPRSR
jgi:Putative quorum-sensing-regulated virulence factor